MPARVLRPLELTAAEQDPLYGVAGGELWGPPVAQALIFRARLTDFWRPAQVAHSRSPGDFCTNM